MVLRKEQVQYWLLGGILGAGVLYAAIFFGLAPLLNSMTIAVSTIAEYDEKIEKAQAFIRQRDQLNREYATAQARIQAASGKIPIPVYKNYLMNMEKTILWHAEGLPVTVENVVAQAQIPIREGKSRFMQFQARVTAKSGFAALMKLMERLEQENPYLSIALLSITPNNDSPELHQISLVISWLVWVDPDKRPIFENEPRQAIAVHGEAP